MYKTLRNIILLVILLVIVGYAFVFITPHKTAHDLVIRQRSKNQNPNSHNPDATPEQPLLIPDKIVQEVPFTSQSPFAHWENEDEDSACEEASLIMAWHWIQGTPLNASIADSELKDLIAYEKQNFGVNYDTSAADTLKVFQSYFNTNQHITVKYDITVDDIITELAQGRIIIIPANGQKLSNPNFRRPGPLTHMLVIKGYDNKAEQFITNDPGTRNGNSYKYSYQTIIDAVRDYPTGKHEPITTERSAMLIIKK